MAVTEFDGLLATPLPLRLTGFLRAIVVVSLRRKRVSTAFLCTAARYALLTPPRFLLQAAGLRDSRQSRATEGTEVLSDARPSDAFAIADPPPRGGLRQQRENAGC